MLRSRVDNHGRVLLVEHKRHKRVLHIQNTKVAWARKRQCRPDRRRNRHAPEHVHIENLAPVVEAFPGRPFGPDGGIIHEDTDLREETRREPCEVIAARRIQPPPMEALRCRTDNGG